MSKYSFESSHRKRDLMRANSIRWTLQILLLISAGLVLSYLWLFFQSGRLRASLIVVSVCFVLTLVIQGKWYWDRKRYFAHGAGIKESLSDNITLSTLTCMDIPVLICGQDGKVIWYNDKFTKRNGKQSPIYGRHLQEVTGGVSLEKLMEAQTGNGMRCTLGDYTYDVYAYPMTSENNVTSYITVWEDHTHEAFLQQKMQDDDTTFTYVMIDNLQELLQFADRTYRGTTAKIAENLNEWAKSLGGFLKECGNDKYLMVCRAQAMIECSQNKFEILDTVRDLHTGEEGTPLTISIGVSRAGGTLQEKEAAAQEALDIALQRGGDQAVVRTATGLEFYGGRSKSVQKRTKVRSRVIANELVRLMEKSSNIVVMGHRNADFDALGACVGIARMAMYLNKKVNIITNVQDENLRLCFERLRENLSEYRNIFLSGTDAQDLVHSESLLVLVDVNNPRQYDSFDLAKAIKRRVVIDHHRKTPENPLDFLMTYIEPSASSASELVSELIEQTLPAGTLEREEADIMYSGILLDTKQFMHNTGVRTFSAALFLRTEGAEPEEAQNLFKTNLADFQRLAKFEQEVEIYRGVCAIARYNGDDTDDGDRIAIAKVADKLLNVQRVQASFVLCHIGESICISARSEGQWNVQIILEKLGGGGHFDAAGAQLRVDMAGAEKKLKEAIDAYVMNEM